MRKPSLAFLFCLLFYPVNVAHAAVTFTENLSELRTSALASVGSPFSFQLDGPFLVEFDEVGIPTSFGDTLSAFAQQTDSDGTSTADITTSIAVDVLHSGPSVVVQMDLTYMTSQAASPGSGEFDSANAEGVALIQLSFDLDQDYAFIFTALGASASGTPELEFELRNPAGGADAFDVSVIDATQDLTFSGVLAAGSDNKIIIAVDDSANLGVANGGAATGSASILGAELVLTPIPVPAALPLLLGALGALAWLRRPTN